MSFRSAFFVITAQFVFIAGVFSQTERLWFDIPEKPFSYVPYRDFEPCYDTLKVLWVKKTIEVGLAMPEWHPVRNHKDNVVFEGTLIKTPNSIAVNTHVSQEDMPLYHYTHDFSFNAIPDEYPDNRYRNLLSTIVEEKTEGGVTRYDTTEQEYLHMEWETGLGASSKNNPCTKDNCSGSSSGFYSCGHERGDTIWNWPTIGDWIHAEGLWIWDRGHPPADAEIHPLRFTAIRRHLPEKINHPEKPGKTIWATRIDVFGSGDGGALYNNRPNKPPFAHPVKMGEKSYDFDVQSIFSPPSENAVLRFIEVTQKGNTFHLPVEYAVTKSSADITKLSIHIPWKGEADTLVLAKTVFLYWDEGEGKPAELDIHTYKVILEEIRFLNRKEFFSQGEMRAYAEVGGKWFFLNELFGKDDILRAGRGKSFGKRWKLGMSFIVHVPSGTEFRVHANSWECDGIDARMGNLVDPYLLCTRENKKQFRKALNAVSPLRFKGCLNDLMGEVHDFYTPEMLSSPVEKESLSTGDNYEDFCVCNKDVQQGMMSLKYRIEKIKE